MGSHRWGGGSDAEQRDAPEPPIRVGFEGEVTWRRPGDRCRSPLNNRNTKIMTWNAREILAILDRCSDAHTFPMLDNGYIYLAATRLALFRSSQDWAIVIEVFGFSPRAGLPDTCIQTFASCLHNRNSPDNYVTQQAYENYLSNNESRSVFPIAPGDWQDSESGELVAPSAVSIMLRDKPFLLPSAAEFDKCGITLEEPPHIQVFELCRLLADRARDEVLATPNERRVSILPEMEQILLLGCWHHPNLVEDERPSQSETFLQLADVLVTGDVSRYRPTMEANTHWRNWPEGGRL
jgi:hypothetical protein